MQSKSVRKYKYKTSEYREYRAKLSEDINVQVVNIDGTEPNC